MRCPGFGQTFKLVRPADFEWVRCAATNAKCPKATRLNNISGQYIYSQRINTLHKIISICKQQKLLHISPHYNKMETLHFETTEGTQICRTTCVMKEFRQNPQFCQSIALLNDRQFVWSNSFCNFRRNKQEISWNKRRKFCQTFDILHLLVDLSTTIKKNIEILSN